MNTLNSIDPFLMQLVIVPLFVIGLGLVASIFTKKLYIAPICTLLLNFAYESITSWIGYGHLSLTMWNVIFPLVSFIIAWFVLFVKRGSKVN
ncbi:hypothetical protein SAMN05421736_106180 [Evansella caseinilytica]|uniref:Uncharacterized protein n=1 Tax=Evansella caseinilytica TaxID=1503961 RepID=A0A1H3QHK0_9BACI|nr:hypothetical protein SAMN05421736_106180 [Evansella caseinilytica]